MVNRNPEFRQPSPHEIKSDVPELADEVTNEDAEVIKPAETPLHEELGFSSIGHMEQARAKVIEIAKEKDLAKADQLRAELKALLDDTDGEAVPISNASLKDTVLARVAEGKERFKKNEQNPALKLVRSKSVEVPVQELVDDKIAQLEFNEGMANATRKVQIDQGEEMLAAIAQESDITVADQLRKELRAYQDENDGKKFDSDSVTYDEVSRQQADEEARKRIANMREDIAKSVKDLITPRKNTDETSAEKWGRGMAEGRARRAKENKEAEEKEYAEGVIEAYDIGKPKERKEDGDQRVEAG